MTAARDRVALLDAESASAGDRAAVEAGDTWAALMERAAGHLARGVTSLAGRAYGLRVTFVVGKGNNGGDGWAAARRVEALGARARVVSVADLDADVSDEAADNRQRWRGAGGRTDTLEALEDALAWCDVAVDCLLGTGATGAPRGDIGKAVAALNAADVPIVACDIPTGVQASDGAVPGDAVRAALTVTFGGLKRGLVVHPGATYAGRVTVGELGPRYAAPEGTWHALTAAGAAPERWSPDADKQARGVVLIVAGSVGMSGAAILAARGALAAGAGLVTVAVPEAILPTVAQAVPPAMTTPFEEGVGERAERADVVVAGPGMGPTARTRELVDTLRATARRLVLDADGINVYRDEGDELADHAGDLVLTPQSRELERIGGADEGPASFAERLGATLVKKGPGTVIAAPDGRVWVTPTGSPALGTGGSGDVLAGMVAALVATTDDVPAATARACWLHALAGDLAGVTRAERATSADIADAVPHALALTRRLAAERPRWPFDPPGWHVGRTPVDEPARVRHDVGSLR